MDAVKQTSFKNYLDNEVYFSNFGHVIDIDGNKIYGMNFTLKWNYIKSQQYC